MKFILPKSNLVTSFDDISLYSTLSNTQINKKKYSLKKNPITKELTNFYNNLF